MKKVFILLIIILLCPLSIVADKINVEFYKCVDGDTTKVLLNKEEITLRLLAIDTPETKHPTKGIEPYGKEASNFTCESLTSATKIEIEYDSNSDILDKYNRHLVWLFVDGKLFQKELIKNGYARTAYLYDDYKYTEELIELEKIAQQNKIGIWTDYKEINKIHIVLCIIIIVILCFFSKKYKKKVIKKLKSFLFKS